MWVLFDLRPSYHNRCHSSTQCLLYCIVLEMAIHKLHNVTSMTQARQDEQDWQNESIWRTPPSVNEHWVGVALVDTTNTASSGLGPGTSTSMKNGYSIVILRIEKGPFSKDIFSNFTPFLHENKEKLELKFTPFFLQNKDIFRNLTPFSCEIYPIFQIKSNQIKIKYLHFKSIWTPLFIEIIKTLALKLTLLPCLTFQWGSG